jgi:pyruvate/2-oxoglutarate dehydrogenase complex dihydrolipoamide acyltransferase (E2) component
MAHDIILPMLGMAQDTGIIVAWHKEIGDAVKASDILMEVETDKSVVEVEAGHDGFVVALRAETGVPIPVGEVVAVVSDDKNDVEAPSAPSQIKEEATPAPQAPAAEEKPAPQESAPAAPTPAAAPPAPRKPAPQSSSGRILASPKARRQAEERGIDLGRLVRLGVPQPFHVSDLDKAGSAASFQGSETSYMRVVIEKAPFAEFVSWLNEETDEDIASLHLWAAFTAGALRKTAGLGNDQDIVVDASAFPGSGEMAALKNPDQVSLTGIASQAGDGAAAITILDLSDTPLAEYRPAGGTPLPHLTVANSDGDATLSIALAFDPASLDEPTAFNFLTDLAARAQYPLRQLL